MKKAAIFLTTVLALTSCSAAIAADTSVYDSTDYSVTVGDDISAYTTVLITNDSTDDIVYVCQAESTFEASMDFLLKTNPAAGNYTVKLGRADMRSAKTMSFTVDAAEFTKTQTQMTKRVSEDMGNGKYRMSFNLNAVNLSGYNVITVKIGNVLGGYDLSDVFPNMSGDVNLGLQINNIPSEYKDIIEVYLGYGTLSSNSVSDWSAE